LCHKCNYCNDLINLILHREEEETEEEEEEEEEESDEEESYAEQHTSTVSNCYLICRKVNY
jgi:hypothetical protein